MNQEQQPERNELIIMHMGDYVNVELGAASEWLTGEALPEDIALHLRDVEPTATLLDVLVRINDVLRTYVFQGQRSHPDSFDESRFTPLSDAVRNRLSSCGSIANMFAAACRMMGIPTKLVHGRLNRQQKDAMQRHAWLEIYVPSTGAWMGVDPTTPDFQMQSGANKLGEYHQWSELREDFKRGDRSL